MPGQLVECTDGRCESDLRQLVKYRVDGVETITCVPEAQLVTSNHSIFHDGPPESDTDPNGS